MNLLTKKSWKVLFCEENRDAKVSNYGQWTFVYKYNATDLKHKLPFFPYVEEIPLINFQDGRVMSTT